jgi:hypothetical protein
MKEIKTPCFIGFNYEGLNNAGDHIQSIATERLLPGISARYNRDSMGLAHTTVKSFLIMNGWFSHTPETCLPASPHIIPIFWGFHISNYNNGWSYFSQNKIIDYLKKYEPIGCRDPYTADKLSSLGVTAFISKCLTLTLPIREEKPESDLIIIVDGDRVSQPNTLPVNKDKVFLPEYIKNEALILTHRIYPLQTEEKKRIYARHLLSVYKKASLIITTRLHCLLPCIAMGIPVIFIGDRNDYRVSWVSELGINIYSPEEVEQLDLDPVRIDFEKEKYALISEFQHFVQNKIL